MCEFYRNNSFYEVRSFISLPLLQNFTFLFCGTWHLSLASWQVIQSTTVSQCCLSPEDTSEHHLGSYSAKYNLGFLCLKNSCIGLPYHIFSSPWNNGFSLFFWQFSLYWFLLWYVLPTFTGFDIWLKMATKPPTTRDFPGQIITSSKQFSRTRSHGAVIAFSPNSLAPGTPSSISLTRPTQHSLDNSPKIYTQTQWSLYTIIV